MNPRLSLLIGLILMLTTGCDILNPQNNQPDVPEPPEIPQGPPDLVISLSGPSEVRAGQDVGPEMIIEVENIGGGIVLGTRDAEGNPQEGGYFIDFVLSTDQNVPAGFANYYDEFVEDGLLRGGRKTNTPNLIARLVVALSEESASLPSAIPLGDYYICARIDPNEVVEETDETNNVSCFATRVVE